MLTLTVQQLDNIAESLEAHVLLRSAAYVRVHRRAWAEHLSSEDLQSFVAAIRDFGLERNVHSERSLHTLIDEAVEGGWSDPPPALADYLLSRNGFGEAARVRDWRAAVRGSRLKLIDLDLSGDFG